ncbi:hypothetical protein [Listeria costaricensis]|uniref:hypothetical protein n=1 Tax=Listeria costaricensis TaxID=2026604 RepID=UPI000C072B5E|nr:hypothetical protein [Listeria costaricensis]
MPEQGVFTAYDPDPGDEDDPISMNGYIYVGNNPTMGFDPDGHFAIVAPAIPWLYSAGVAAAPAIGYGIGTAGKWAWKKTRQSRNAYGTIWKYRKPIARAGYNLVKGKKRVKTKNITKKKSIPNYKLNTTRRQFEQRLRRGGWKQKKIAPGIKQFSNKGRKIVTRSKSRQGNPSADFYNKAGKKTKKFRFYKHRR